MADQTVLEFCDLFRHGADQVRTKDNSDLERRITCVKSRGVVAVAQLSPLPEE